MHTPLSVAVLVAGSVGLQAMQAGCGLTKAQDATLAADAGQLTTDTCEIVGLFNGQDGAVCSAFAPIVTPLVSDVTTLTGASAKPTSCALTPITADAKKKEGYVCAWACGDMGKATPTDPCPRIDAALRADAEKARKR